MLLPDCAEGPLPGQAPGKESMCQQWGQNHQLLQNINVQLSSALPLPLRLAPSPQSHPLRLARLRELRVHQELSMPQHAKCKRERQKSVPVDIGQLTPQERVQ
jgi:hypothetical protein